MASFEGKVVCTFLQKKRGNLITDMVIATA